MIDPSQVSAVIVTRGNVDLTPILETLIFDDVVIFNNSAEPEDAMTYGIVPAVERAKRPVIYSQDDDIVHTPEDQARIVGDYFPGFLTGCMWPEWSAGAAAQGITGGYHDLVFYGSGAVYDRRLPGCAAAEYLKHYPNDEFFRLWFSCIFGILCSTRQLPIQFDALPCAEADYRMCNLPDAELHKAEAIRRAREVRDAKADVHALYMGEHRAGRVREHRYL